MKTLSATAEAKSNSGMADAYALLETSMFAALETYANVHRGSGPASADTTRLYGSDWVMWAKAPDRYEAGTPAIINCIAFAKALMIIQQSGMDLLKALREDWIGQSLVASQTNRF